MNSFTVTGFTKYVEHKVTSSGKNLIKFQVTVLNPKYKADAPNSYTYVRCSFWGDVPLEDGMEVMVHGSFYSTTYDAKDGTKKPDFGMNAETIAVINRGRSGSLHQASTPDPISVSEDVDEQLPF